MFPRIVPFFSMTPRLSKGAKRLDAGLIKVRARIVAEKIWRVWPTGMFGTFDLAVDPTAQDAELVSLGIGQDLPRRLALANVYPART